MVFSASADTWPPPLDCRSERLIQSSNGLLSGGRERCDNEIRLAEDEALLQRVVEQEALLTVCLLGNVLLRCVSKIEVGE